MMEPGDVPTSGAGAISTEQFTALMNAIRASKATLEATLDDKFKEFKKEVQDSQDQSVERVAKKARAERPSSFRFKGNEDQFYFNQKVIDTVDEASAQLDRATSDAGSSSSSKLSDTLEKTKKAVMEGKKLLLQRQKHIRLADRSEHGWKVVQEYEADELAADDADEKRIAKAIKAADQKAATEKKKGHSTSSRVPQARPSQFNRSQSQYRRGPYGYSGARPFGQCHACHQWGHHRDTCPKYNRGQPYPLITDCVNEEVSGMSSVSDLDKEPVNLSPIDGESTEHSEVLAPRYWEATEHAPVSVKGRLKESFEFWANHLQATKPILDIVQHGYYLPFLRPPDSYSSPNHKSALLNAEFIDTAIADLLSNNCVKLVAQKPHVCSPLLVVENAGGKKRLVINLKYINMYLWKVKFKYEDIRSAMMFFEKGDYLCTFDLKSGYHHVDIHVDSQTYLGFEWKQKYYMFTVLPFGLATACYVFTKLLRPVVKYLRTKGIRIVVYLDDGIAVGPDFNQTTIICDLIRDTLTRAGFVLNQEKSKLHPSRAGRWLGFDIDLEKGCILVPQDKIVRLKEFLSQALTAECLPAKVVASITGRIISLSLAIGSIARLRTRALYALLDSRESWYDHLVLNEEARAEIVFWLNSLQHYNGQPIWRSPSALNEEAAHKRGVAWPGTCGEFE